jgi:hypothetical protein
MAGLLLFVINSQVEDKINERVSPIEIDMALIKNDQGHVKRALEEIKVLLTSQNK